MSNSFVFKRSNTIGFSLREISLSSSSSVCCFFFGSWFKRARWDRWRPMRSWAVKTLPMNQSSMWMASVTFCPTDWLIWLFFSTSEVVSQTPNPFGFPLSSFLSCKSLLIFHFSHRNVYLYIYFFNFVGIWYFIESNTC